MFNSQNNTLQSDPQVYPSSTVTLPASARAALETLAKQYLTWLEQNDKPFLLPVMTLMQDDMRAAPPDMQAEALAEVLQNAPLFGAFMREVAYAAQFSVRFVELPEVCGG